MLNEGARLQDRYLINRHIGTGGMGTVYLATDERFHSTVAIKEALFTEEKFQKSFEREARLLNSLKHSALPKVTDQFVENNAQYIVMEYIDGDDLFEMLRKSGRPFPVSDVMEWTEQLLDALEYLHEQGIIHRDIKPQNLKLTKQGKVILLDFGLAKGNPTDANHQTAAQSIFGYSRNYASLEQMQGTGTDPRSDVYSLAATVYHLITGQVPADALTRIMKVLNENSDPLAPAGQFNNEISQELSDGLDVCLSLKASERPASVSEMREAVFSNSKTDFVMPAGRETQPAHDDLLTQSTKILTPESPSGIRTGGSKQSEIKTEVLSANTGTGSVETKVALMPDEPARGSRWGLIGALSLIVLIVGGVAAMALYWPSSGPVTSDGANSNLERNTNGEESESLVDLTNSDLDVDNANTDPDMTPESQEEAVPTPETVITRDEPKPVPTVERPVATPTAIKPTPTPPSISVKATPPLPTPIPTPKFPISREEFEKLSPAERRRMRRIIDEERRKQGLPPLPRRPLPPPQ